VWVVDFATGEADHIVTGHAGPPKWSPDGSWLVFGFQALGRDDGMSIWMVRADGRQLREVVGDVAFTPVWLPPA
jgi:Tol biopolymer transport system component